MLLRIQSGCRDGIGAGICVFRGFSSPLPAAPPDASPGPPLTPLAPLTPTSPCPALPRERERVERDTGYFGGLEFMLGGVRVEASVMRHQQAPALQNSKNFTPQTLILGCLGAPRCQSTSTSHARRLANMQQGTIRTAIQSEHVKHWPLGWGASGGN